MSTLPQVHATIDFTVGSRRLLSVQRRLATWVFSLEDALAACREIPASPSGGRDGFRVLSAPIQTLPAITARFPDHVIGARQDYPRHFITMRDVSFDDYMAGFSGKTRSTLRRKARKLRSEIGEGFAITEHRTPCEIEHFFDQAAPLSARTYQARLLHAGLPDTQAARDHMRALAGKDRMRAYLLHGSDGPLAYLALPIEGSAVIYAHLGYDPDWARLSPGTVLQMEALERLFAEERYTYFDFTEGDGAHKAMFGTDSIDCASFVLLAPGLANRALVTSRSAFDAGVAFAKVLAQRSGALARIRARLRA